jgi:hypothetical protein
MTSHILTPGIFDFNTCLHYTCVSQFQSETFNNVQWAYFADDPNGARNLMLNATEFAMKAQSMNSSLIKAVVVDTTNNWGGFPEDLAGNAQAAGFDILVMQEIGDEEFNCGFGAGFSNSKHCSIPIFRTSSALSAEFSKAQLVELTPGTVLQSTVVVSSLLFSLQIIAGGILLIATILRLYGLGAPKKFNTGICMCYLALAQALTALDLSIMEAVGIFPARRSLNHMVHYALENVFSMTATFVMSREFEMALLTIKGLEDEGWKHPRVIAFSVFIVLVDIGNIVIGVLVGNQVWGISNIYHGLFFLNCSIGGLLAIYFLWGYRKIIRIMHNGNDLKSNDESVYMGRRLMFAVLFTVLWIVDAALMGINSVYYFHGMSYPLVSLLMTFSLLNSFAQVNALPLKAPLFPCLHQNQRSKMSDAVHRKARITDTSSREERQTLLN